jgi:hypothetical protein
VNAQMSAMAVILITLASPVLTGCSSPSTPSAAVDLSGTWTGTASDAGSVRWTITQAGSAVTGTMTLFDPATNAVVVSGSIAGTIRNPGVGQRLTFEQKIAFFAFPSTGPWSRYYTMGFDTSGTLILSSGNQLGGPYLGSANDLRSPPNPPGSGGPFTNGTLALTRQ